MSIINLIMVIVCVYTFRVVVAEQPRHYRLIALGNAMFAVLNAAAFAAGVR